MQTADKNDDAHGDQAGADLALFLARHKIKVNLVERQIKGDHGEALLSIAADLATHLIVMGGYGHTRFRELVLGGVTRTLLQSMTVPVLMAH
jgi:nucleotide-binding universal stress UspA family protein